MTQPEGQTARDIFPEDEGLPEVANDDSPTAELAEDPEFAPLPGERPGASTDFGTTSLEQAEGESLDGRLAREIPDDIEATADLPVGGGEGPEARAMHVTDD